MLESIERYTQESETVTIPFNSIHFDTLSNTNLNAQILEVVMACIWLELGHLQMFCKIVIVCVCYYGIGWNSISIPFSCSGSNEVQIVNGYDRIAE